uniref:Uncharacterized protein n=1 Tax=Trichogramma kaykai TaxID=54128 RepID=A0ABD2WZL2_9HYME
MIGWPTIKDNKGKIDAESNHLEINGYKIPFTGMEILEIPPRTRHVIYAYVSNTEQQVGMVPNMHEGLLFGNFLSVNREGRVYAIAINTTSEIIKLRPPTVQLLPVKEINDSDSSSVLTQAKKVQVLSCEMEIYLKTERVKKIFELLDPKTLEHLNDEEIQHIKDLISESPYTFELPGEPLKPTNVITHKIETTSDIPAPPVLFAVECERRVCLRPTLVITHVRAERVKYSSSSEEKQTSLYEKAFKPMGARSTMR